MPLLVSWQVVTVHGSFFFPWTQPVRLAQEQTVCVNLAAKLVENDYLWRWTTHIEPLPGSGTSPVHFDQSQFAGAVLSGGQLRRGAADYIPWLSEEGILRRRTFELMDGKLSLDEIAHRLAAEFPKRFSSWQQALSYAGVVSQEYSR